MLRTAITIALVIAALTISTRAQAAEPRVYCVLVVNQKNRSNNLHYKIRACPVGKRTCDAQWTTKKLVYRGRNRTRGQGECVLKLQPVQMIIAFDEGTTSGYQEVQKVLTPQSFAWREQWPGVGCLRASAYQFVHRRGRLTLRAGLPRRARGGKCEWETNTNRLAPRANIGLPEELVGSWVERREDCPLEPARRGARTLWLQRHGIERGERQCWLSDTFQPGRRFTARAICRNDDGDYKLRNFTFDRITQNSMRMRESGKRRRRYKRCATVWRPAPKDEKLKALIGPAGRTLGFDVAMTVRDANGHERPQNHTRTMRLQIDGSGRIVDQQSFARGRKTSKGRPGEVVRDSGGNRVVWSIQGQRIERIRERLTFFEIFSWPITALGTGIGCKPIATLLSKRRDSLLRLIASNGTTLDIKSYGWHREKCAASVATGRPRVENMDHCLKATLTSEPTKKPHLHRVTAHLKNTCSMPVAGGAFAWFDNRAQGHVVTVPPGDTPQEMWWVTLDKSQTVAALRDRLIVWGTRASSYHTECRRVAGKKKNWRPKSRCLERLRGPVAVTEANKERLAAFLYMRGKYYVTKKTVAVSIDDLDRAIQLAPSEADYWAKRGVARALLAEIGKRAANERRAIADFKEAAELNPDHRIAVYQLLKRGIRPQRTSPLSLCLLGGNTDHGIKLCTEVIQTAKDPKVVSEAYVRRGRANDWIAIDTIDDLAMQRLVGEDPNGQKFDHAKHKRMANKINGHLKAAFSDFVAAIKADPKNPQAYRGLGNLWRTQAGRVKGDAKKAARVKAAMAYFRGLSVAKKGTRACRQLLRAYQRLEVEEKPDVPANRCG